jgi:hypothetical protein
VAPVATSAYHRWDRDGRPWKPARPVKALAERLKAHGYTCYIIGSDDRSHLQADFPEDHSPFSKTGWPGPNPYPFVLALDVMPPKKGHRSKIDGQPLPSLQALGRQLRADKMSGHRGVAWLKYMNHEPERDWGGPCWHESWQPLYRRRGTEDRGHIHMSCRTDFHLSAAADDYDPVARIRAGSEGGDDVSWTDDVIPLWGAHRTKTNPTARPTWVLSNVGRWTEETVVAARTIRAELAAVRKTQAAILAATAGQATAATIIAHIDKRAAEDAARDAKLQELVAKGQDGTSDPAEVIRQIGALLGAVGAGPDG